jgi:hypothetical protein
MTSFLKCTGAAQEQGVVVLLPQAQEQLVGDGWSYHCKVGIISNVSQKFDIQLLDHRAGASPNTGRIGPRVKGAWPSRPCGDWRSCLQRTHGNHGVMCRTQAGRLCPSLFLSKMTALGGTPAIKRLTPAGENHAQPFISLKADWFSYKDLRQKPTQCPLSSPAKGPFVVEQASRLLKTNRPTTRHLGQFKGGQARGAFGIIQPVNETGEQLLGRMRYKEGLSIPLERLFWAAGRSQPSVVPILEKAKAWQGSRRAKKTPRMAKTMN